MHIMNLQEWKCCQFLTPAGNRTYGSMEFWSFDQNKVAGSIPGWIKKMAKFAFLQLHDVHQFDHMDCEFFPLVEREIIDCGEWENRSLSYLKSSREFLDYGRRQAKPPGFTTTKKWVPDGNFKAQKVDSRFIFLADSKSDEFLEVCWHPPFSDRPRP